MLLVAGTIASKYMRFRGSTIKKSHRSVDKCREHQRREQRIIETLEFIEYTEWLKRNVGQLPSRFQCRSHLNLSKEPSIRKSNAQECKVPGYVSQSADNSRQSRSQLPYPSDGDNLVSLPCPRSKAQSTASENLLN